jgi:hypothetical protein
LIDHTVKTSKKASGNLGDNLQVFSLTRISGHNFQFLQSILKAEIFSTRYKRLPCVVLALT